MRRSPLDIQLCAIESEPGYAARNRFGHKPRSALWLPPAFSFGYASGPSSGRCQRQSGLETAGLNTGELIGTNFDDFVDGFLTGAAYPHLAFALATYFLGQGLQIQEHIGIRANVLASLVNHEQESEISGLLST